MDGPNNVWLHPSIGVKNNEKMVLHTEEYVALKFKPLRVKRCKTAWEYPGLVNNPMYRLILISSPIAMPWLWGETRLPKMNQKLCDHEHIHTTCQKQSIVSLALETTSKLSSPNILIPIKCNTPMENTPGAELWREWSLNDKLFLGRYNPPGKTKS